MKIFINKYFPLIVGVLILCLSFTLKAKADDDHDDSWFTAYGYVRNIYYNPHYSRTNVIFETDDHKVLTLNLYTPSTWNGSPVPAIWIGEHVKVDYGHRWIATSDAPFLVFKAQQLPETAPAPVVITSCPAPHVYVYWRRHHRQSALPHGLDRDPLPNRPAPTE